MSYCRWSSDFFECDVYVYEDVAGGYTCHVAGRRRKAEYRVPDELRNIARFKGGTPGERWLAQYQAVKDWERENVPVVPYTAKDTKGNEVEGFSLADDAYEDITHESAGNTVTTDYPGEMAEVLYLFKEQGLNVPQYAIDELMAEEKERVNG